MKHEGGFIMADTICAVLVASLLLSALLGANQLALRASASAERSVGAALLARAVLEDRSIREKTGTFTIGQTVYRFHREDVRRAGRAAGAAQLTDTVVTVRWDGPSGEQAFALRTASIGVTGHE